MPTATTSSNESAKSYACKDRELVEYVVRHGIVTIGHVMAAMKVGKTATYRRVARCVEAGLLERQEVLRTEPTLLRATREGLRYVGLGLPIASFAPGGIEHYLRCASVAQMLSEELPDHRIFTEQEIPVLEDLLGRPAASVMLEDLPDGRARRHRGDLLVVSKDEQDRIAVEVELTRKAPHRLRSIIRGWRLAPCVSEVRYYCRTGVTHSGVKRAVKAVQADAVDKIVVIEGVPE
jgi:hypothetical protein